jgi:hypothetical protein
MERRSSPGTILDAGFFGSERELGLAEYLAAQGNYVRGVARDAGGRRTADAAVSRTARGKGTSVELEHPRPGLVTDHALRLIRDAVDSAKPQARNVVVDLRDLHDERGIPLTDDVARRTAARLEGIVRGWRHPLDYVRFVGDTFDLTFGPFS